ncbi:MAG: hypothetical protein ACXVKJ_18815 [Ilumatobacteraceae bacterium]
MERNDMDDHTGSRAPATSAPRIAGYRYATPTGDPCPRTIRVDGTIENGGNCQSCGTCLLYSGLIDPSPTQHDEAH